ncbi:MAG: hypothetical protein GY811_03990 [Myxococcales bacterium]|nr:hypothetical protein [Myxococcales bacterium]
MAALAASAPKEALFALGASADLVISAHSPGTASSTGAPHTPQNREDASSGIVHFGQ